MSMNLYIRFDGKNIDVHQTPTYITYMCLMTADGSKDKMTGNEARRAVLCYVEYLKGKMNGSYTSIDEMNNWCDPIKAHIASVLSELREAKRVEVYML